MANEVESGSADCRVFRRDLGYVFNFQGGAFDLGGKAKGSMTQAEIDAHNKALAVAEVESMKQTGQAVLYLRTKLCPDGFKRDFVGTWEGSFNFQVCNRNTSKHNMAGKRLDLWFVGPDGKTWHGVNIGDNQIVRCHRNKQQ